LYFLKEIQSQLYFHVFVIFPLYILFLKTILHDIQQEIPSLSCSTVALVLLFKSSIEINLDIAHARKTTQKSIK